MTARGAFGDWRAQEDLKDSDGERNRSESRGISCDTAHSWSEPTSASAVLGAEALDTFTPSKYSPEDVDRAVEEALRALRAGRVDIAIDVLTRMQRSG